MADKKKKKIAPHIYDQERDKKAIEAWKSLVTSVADPDANKKDIARANKQTRSENRRLIQKIFGQDIGPSKEEKESELFDKKPEPIPLAERIASAETSTPPPPTPSRTPPPPKPSRRSLAETVRSAGEVGPPRSAMRTAYDNLSDELKNARKDYQRERDRLDLREAIESVAHGVGQIGAGMFGRRTGTDMSGVKFDKKDWERKRDRAQGDFRTSLEDISTRRREQVAQDQHATEMEYKNKVLQETSRHNKAMERLTSGRMAADAAKQVSKLKGADLQNFRKTVDKVNADIYSIAKDVERKGVTEDVARQRIQAILQNSLGVSPEMAEEIVTDKGWFFDSMKDIDEIQSKVNALAAQQLTLKAYQAQLNEGEVLAIDPQGNPMAINAAEAEQYAAAGFKVLN